MDSRVIVQVPLRLIVRTSVITMLMGMLIFMALLAGLSAPIWSRPALVLQGLAVLLALVVYHCYRIRRFLLYPLLLAGAIYLWDTTLPPPTLPAGVLRVLIPGIVMGGILGHLTYT